MVCSWSIPLPIRPGGGRVLPPLQSGNLCDPEFTSKSHQPGGWTEERQSTPFGVPSPAVAKPKMATSGMPV